MSAVNIIRRKRHGREDGIVLLTDGAWYTSEGIVQAIASKILVLPHIPAAIAARGPVALQPLLFGIAYPCRDFEDLLTSLKNFEDHLVSFVKSNSNVDNPLLDQFEVLIAGYSHERKGFETYVTANYQSLTLLSGDQVSPPPDAAIIKQSGWQIPALNRFDADRDGLRLMDCQRAIGPPHVVGGFVQKTIVERDGVRSSIIHTWPDEVGRKINPEASR